MLPEPFSGESGWTEWEYHFNNVAAVNNWTEVDKLKWPKVRLTGRAQVAFQRLPEQCFDVVTLVHKLQFKPPSQKMRYQEKLQLKKKKIGSLADLANDLHTIAERAYPDLSDKAKEMFTLNAYLPRLDNPEVAFSVKQKTPEDLDEADLATVEL